MEKHISAMYARKNFGQLLNEVSLLRKDFVIHRAGRPMAALVPADDQDGKKGADEELIAAYYNLVKRIKGPRSKKLDKAIGELAALLGCEPL